MTTIQIILIMFLTSCVSVRFVRNLTRHPERPLVYFINGIEILALATIFKMMNQKLTPYWGLTFWRAAHERERPNFPLYHTIRNLSIGKVHKEINNLFPEKGLTFAVISCIIRYTTKEGNNSRLKKSFEKFKKTLDKLLPILGASFFQEEMVIFSNCPRTGRKFTFFTSSAI